MLTDVPASQSEDLKMLPVRNPLRSSRVGLLTGQAVAEKIKAKPLTPQEVATGEGFDVRTPLWFYIPKESQVQAGGQRLGEVGSRIVGEVFVGLLEGDPRLFLHAQPAWTPTLPSQTPGTLKLGVSFWQYLTDRISHTYAIPPLPDFIQQRAASNH